LLDFSRSEDSPPKFDDYEIEKENGKIEKVHPIRMLKEIYKYMHGTILELIY